LQQPFVWCCFFDASTKAPAMPLSHPMQDTVMNVLATSVYSLQRLIELMGSAGTLFTHEEAAEASESLRAHLVSFMWLAAFHFEKRIPYFKVRCKTHYLFHVAKEIEVTHVNPALFENWHEESYLGKLKRVAIRCHGSTCTQKVFLRYLLCLATYLQQFRKKTILLD